MGRCCWQGENVCLIWLIVSKIQATVLTWQLVTGLNLSILWFIRKTMVRETSPWWIIAFPIMWCLCGTLLDIKILKLMWNASRLIAVRGNQHVVNNVNNYPHDKFVYF